ncbi:MAG: hypothetical protein PHE55_02805 [Methylococcaceae bacterium]|nr:hypothetical protein [Methylococcaceae bacterium]
MNSQHRTEHDAMVRYRLIEEGELMFDKRRALTEFDLKDIGGNRLTIALPTSLMEPFP